MAGKCLYMQATSSQDGGHGVSDVPLDLGDLLLLLLVREGRLLVQDPHLLHQRRLAGLAGAQQQQPVRRLVRPLVLLDLQGGGGGGRIDSS